MVELGIVYVLALFSHFVSGQLDSSQSKPIPILRQINTNNQDGSYTYGYEAGDGSYKIETKSVSGEVKGKYGYYDDQGQLREIEYGATNHGFVPSGSGIHPELSERALLAGQEAESFQRQNGRLSGSNAEDDGQYRPEEYEAPYAYVPENQALASPVQNQAQAAYYNFPQQEIPVARQQRPGGRLSRRHHQRQHVQQPAVGPQFNGEAYRPQRYQNAYQPQFSQNVFQGHPATNINLNSGTYSIAY